MLCSVCRIQHPYTQFNILLHYINKDAPDIMKIVKEGNVLPSSTNPTRPFTKNTIDEHLDMVISLCVNAISVFQNEDLIALFFL